MASVRGNVNYDLARGVRLYEEDGPLPERAAALWRVVASADNDMARAFWQRYRRSDEVMTPISDAKITELVADILPYLRDKFERIASPKWVETARDFVESALAKNVTLSTLLAGLAAQTDAAFAALRASVEEGPELVNFCRTLSDVQMLEIDVFVASRIGNIDFAGRNGLRKLIERIALHLSDERKSPQTGGPKEM